MSTYPLTCYFDGACPVCNREMRALEAQDAKGNIRLIDISTPGFDAAEWGYSLDAMRESLHVVDASGQLLRGMDAIHAAHEAVGLGHWYRWTRQPLLRPVIDVAYRLFARYRKQLSPAALRILDIMLRDAERRHCDAAACTFTARRGL